MSDGSDWNSGCKAKFNLLSCLKPDEVKFVEIPFTGYYGFDLDFNGTPISLKDYSDICLKNFRC